MILQTRKTTIDHKFTIEGITLKMSEQIILEDYIFNDVGHEIKCTNTERKNEYMKEPAVELEINLKISSLESMTIIDEWVKEVEEAIKAYLLGIRPELGL